MTGKPTDNHFVEALDRLVNYMSANPILVDGRHALTRGDPNPQSGEHNYANLSNCFSNSESTSSAPP